MIEEKVRSETLRARISD